MCHYLFQLIPGSKSAKNAAETAVKLSNSPRGLYIYGSVGTGKTMLMDLFYDACSTEMKQRVHFHEFMLEVHQRIHEFKKTVPRQYNVRKYDPYDPIPPVARDIADQSWLLCFDEFQVRICTCFQNFIKI